MRNGNKSNRWKYCSIGLLGLLVASFGVSRADAAADISQLTQQILAIVKSTTYGNQAIRNAITALQTSLNGLDTDNLDVAVSTRASQASVDALQSHAITVTALEPTEDIEILPLEEDVMYKGHISGIMTVGGVAANAIGLNCALHADNAPTLTMVSLGNNAVDPAVFQSAKIDANFTCTSLRLSGVGEQTSANLAIDYTVIAGIQEIEPAP